MLVATADERRMDVAVKVRLALMTTCPVSLLPPTTTMLSRRLCSRQHLQRLYTTQLHHSINASHNSSLGLRSRHPPDTISSQKVDDGGEAEPPKKRRRSPESEEISDSEWEMRTGMLKTLGSLSWVCYKMRADATFSDFVVTL